MLKQLAVLSVFLVLGALAAPVFDNPGVQDRLFIDTFVAGADIQGIVRNTVGTEGNVWPGDFSGSDVQGILGGERDLFLEVTMNTNSFGSVYTSIGTDGEFFYWDTNTPQGATGQAYLQWDGSDNNPEVLSTNLNEDFSRGGSNTHFHVRVSRDISVEYNIRVVSPGGGTCEVGFRAQGTDGSTLAFQDVWIPFTDFTNSGSCSFSNVGGVQLGVAIREGVDPRVFLFSVAGNEPSPTPTNTPTPTSIPSPSQTGTPTSVPSQSRTPTPTGTGTRTPTPIPSQSRTPTPTPTQTRTPTPTPSPECICICPAFTCALIFDPDDDVNNVYYFTGPGFTFPDQPDDDDDDRNTNSFTISLGDSGASVLTVSIALIAVIAALF